MQISIQLHFMHTKSALPEQLLWHHRCTASFFGRLEQLSTRWMSHCRQHSLWYRIRLYVWHRNSNELHQMHSFWCRIDSNLIEFAIDFVQFHRRQSNLCGYWFVCCFTSHFSRITAVYRLKSLLIFLADFQGKEILQYTHKQKNTN